jgi:hypothetical protein
MGFRSEVVMDDRAVTQLSRNVEVRGFYTTLGESRHKYKD